MDNKKTAVKQVATAQMSIDAKVQQAVAKELKLLNDIANKSKKSWQTWKMRSMPVCVKPMCFITNG